MLSPLLSSTPLFPWPIRLFILNQHAPVTCAVSIFDQQACMSIASPSLLGSAAPPNTGAVSMADQNSKHTFPWFIRVSIMNQHALATCAVSSFVQQACMSIASPSLLGGAASPTIGAFSSAHQQPQQPRTAIGLP